MKNLHKKAIERFGEGCQIRKAIEEMAELTKELEDYLVGNGELPFIVQELSDVQNMVAQLQIIFDIEDEEKEKIMMSKMERCLNGDN